MQTLFTNCTLYCGPGSELIESGYLLVDGTLIAEIGTGKMVRPTPDARIVDCRGKLLMPGLINGHCHAAMTLFRGLADDLDLTSWLHDHIFPAEKTHVSREMVYWCTRLAAAEMILSGTTCVADGYFFSGESAKALADCGMRAVVGHGVVDFPAPSVPDPKKNIETVADFIDQWQGANPRISPAVFAHAPYTCSPATLSKAKELADARGVRFFTHLAEGKGEAGMIIDPQGKSPLRHMAALDLLDANSVLIHTIWLDDEDLDILAASGARVVSCPQSNLKLASGIARIPEMLERGVTVGLGTDGSASNNGLDMFCEMDILAKIHKVQAGDSALMPAATVLQAATTAGGEVLDLAGLGRLEAGAPADLILLDTEVPHLTPLYNPDLLVYAAVGSDVHSSMIGGKMVMENREILSFDYAETATRVRELSTPLRSQTK